MMSSRSRPRVISHVAVSLDGATTEFAPDMGVFYGLIGTWHEDVTLVGADTILAQEQALAAGPRGPGPDPDGPLLAVVDSRGRVTAWEALRNAGHWRDAIRIEADQPGERVDLRRTLERLAEQGAETVRIDSGGGLSGALLAQGLVDEISLLVHPVVVGSGSAPLWYGASDATAMFTLEHVESIGDGLVWLRYRHRD
ncbi:RibD family protein [Nocardioides panzhihuensis]|uniref:2,5-diamino-6-(Ribosylamino)-4(3H)-pyrimidinone 5'-phosphate reductase n=1 Tax=Nocardioides panzhihuensis TaxID=860243 RepID=A0A7Z0DJJ8_9ACTN|nr:dihydrofolate reductase family protein [Nocardioides panzhihuensis]NYI76784.1 2,5-diamino-6-(ribosylamino)-4(3H)-pyrimidinone 5'-phosphate reductase [Nocardioides panzhihuensis]